MGKTSTEVKRRYNAKTYKGFNVQLKIDLVDEINVALEEKGWSKAEFVRQAANQLLGIDLDEE